jgi:hypothetical protein
LVYGGYPELWEMMLKERMKIKQARERAERVAEIERKKVSAQRLLMAQVVGGAICIVTIGIVVIFIIKQAVS